MNLNFIAVFIAIYPVAIWDGGLSRTMTDQSGRAMKNGIGRLGFSSLIPISWERPSE